VADGKKSLPIPGLVGHILAYDGFTENNADSNAYMMFITALMVLVIGWLVSKVRC